MILGGDWDVVNDLELVDDEVWAATDGGLVRWLPDGRNDHYNSSEYRYPGECVNTLDSVDGERQVWLGCGGVTLVRPNGDQLEFLDHYNRDDGLGMGVVRDLLAARTGTVWAGGNSRPGWAAPELFRRRGMGHRPSRAVSALSEYRDSWPSIRSLTRRSTAACGLDRTISPPVGFWSGMEKTTNSLPTQIPRIMK